MEEDFDEIVEEAEMRMSAKFEALKHFTLEKLKESEKRLDAFEERLSNIERESSEISMKEDISKLDDSLGSLREEFQSFKTLSSPSTQKSKTPPTDESGLKKKPFNGFRFKPLVSVPKEQKIPNTLSDITDNDNLVKALEKYYDGSTTFAGRLTPVQNAFFSYYMVEILEGYTAKRDGIEKLIVAGEKEGVWPRNYKPAGIKNSFRDYLKDKAKNQQKKRIEKEALDSFMNEYTSL